MRDFFPVVYLLGLGSDAAASEKKWGWALGCSKSGQSARPWGRALRRALEPAADLSRALAAPSSAARTPLRAIALCWKQYTVGDAGVAGLEASKGRGDSFDNVWFCKVLFVLFSFVSCDDQDARKQHDCAFVSVRGPCFVGAFCDKTKGAGNGCRWWYVNSWAMTWSSQMYILIMIN